jgi:ketosteroid isomerase-like protein
MAKAMRPLSSVVIEPRRTEVSGNVAAVYGRASWISGAGSASQSTAAVRLIIVWRKGSDGSGEWRRNSCIPNRSHDAAA